MGINEKIIGPMKLDTWAWNLPSGGYLCAAALRKRFNIPTSATKLWVTLTQRCPKHSDAIHIRVDHWDMCVLDNDTHGIYLNREIREEAAEFGQDFYATIHYV